MQGGFIWHELMTTDPAAAAAFYSAVVGWEARDSGMEGMNYTVFYIPGHEMGVAGMMGVPVDDKAEGVPPNWTGYVMVDDVDAMAATFEARGGRVIRQPEDIPGIGRFAVLADPFGGVLAVMKPIMPEGETPPAPPSAATPGAVGWNELYAGEGQEAFAFYSGIFGWSKELSVDMGDMGIYQCFGHDGVAIGGIMPKPPHAPVACWTYYFTVAALDAAIDQATARGGKVLHGPHPVPGGSFIVQCQDPQGAVFAMTAATR